MLSILLDPNLKDELICNTQPVNVEHNSTFIVDLLQLGSSKDIYVGDMGSSKYNGVYHTWVSVESDGFMISHGKSKPAKCEDELLYHLVKKYFKPVQILKRLSSSSQVNLYEYLLTTLKTFDCHVLISIFFVQITVRNFFTCPSFNIALTEKNILLFHVHMEIPRREIVLYELCLAL